ncbi:putative white protein [Cyclospora cayetanensis]|uniref:White protein n=1 Tax=Cyclospora cayetanensis TaxID=88456 RepID=A0A1D3CWR5_9EIME|nr:putative white protein [Cyclospora cayetanensis]
MEASESEVLHQLSTSVPAAGAVDCCEALNIAAFEFIQKPQKSLSRDIADRAPQSTSEKNRCMHFASLPTVQVKVPRRLTGALALPVVQQVASTFAASQAKTLLHGISGVIEPGDMGSESMRLAALLACCLLLCSPPSSLFRLTFRVPYYSCNAERHLPYRQSQPDASQQYEATESGRIPHARTLCQPKSPAALRSVALMVLSRRIVTNTGSVLFNGKALGANAVKRLCCYIQQTAIFYGFITVQEHLDCVARLRTGLRKEARTRLVDSLIELYGLSNVKNSRIGNLQMAAKRGISGGEKKRLNIATEMMTNPSVIFADEPTTGLDASIAENVMRIFQVLANRGRTIICTIHQPSSTIFDMFSKVLLLSQGRIAFFGEREATLLYFSRLGHFCPAFTSVPEYLIELLMKHQLIGNAHNRDDMGTCSPEIVGMLFHDSISCCVYLVEQQQIREKHMASTNSTAVCQDFQDGTSYVDGDHSTPELDVDAAKDAIGRYQPSWIEELLTLTSRAFISNRRNPRLFQARVAQTFILALLEALISAALSPSPNSTSFGSSLLFDVIESTLGMVSVLQTFTVDKVLALREYQSGLYRLSSYYCAKMIADFSLQLSFPILFTTIAWFMIGLNDALVRWLLGMAFILLTTNSAISIGYVISSVAPTLQFASAVVPIVYMPLVLASGFLVILSSMPDFWIWLQYLSPARWGWSGVMHAVWEGAVLDPCPADSFPPQCYSDGDEVLQYYALDRDSLWFSALMILIQIVSIVGPLLPVANKSSQVKPQRKKSEDGQ